MSNLILEMRQGDMMVVNGAALRFRTKSRIELTAHARFLFGRQIMAPRRANTPARRIYYALQTAYIGDAEERRSGMAQAEARIAEFKAATTSPTAIALLDSALALARADQCYQALRIARRIMRHEDAVLSEASQGGGSGEQREDVAGTVGLPEQIAAVAGIEDAEDRISAGVGVVAEQ